MSFIWSYIYPTVNDDTPLKSGLAVKYSEEIKVIDEYLKRRDSIIPPKITHSQKSSYLLNVKHAYNDAMSERARKDFMDELHNILPVLTKRERHRKVTRKNLCDAVIRYLS